MSYSSKRYGPPLTAGGQALDVVADPAAARVALGITSAGSNLITAADAAAARTALGLGTLATQSGTFSEVEDKAFSIQFTPSGVYTAWAAMPSADAFLFGTTANITKADLAQYTEVRLIVKVGAVAGASNSFLALRHTDPFSGDVDDYDPVTESSDCKAPIDAANSLGDSEWIPLVSAARDVRVLAIVGSSGDGIVSPLVGSVIAYFR